MLTKIGETIINPDRVASAHWESYKGQPTLFVYFDGGRFSSYTDEVATRIWELLQTVGGEVI